MLLPALAALLLSAEPVDTATLEDATKSCVKLHEEMAKCPKDFIETMLEILQKHRPEMKKAFDADPKLRDEALQAGIQETKDDGTGDLKKRTEVCKGYAEHGPPVRKSEPAEIGKCLSQKTCAQKVTCLRPILDRRTKEKVDAEAAKAGK